MIDLTAEQVQALEAQSEASLRVINPHTQEVYVLIRNDVYQITCGIVSGLNRRGWDQDDDLIRKQA